MIIDEFETEDAFEDEITKYDYLMGQMADHHGDCPYGFYQVNLGFAKYTNFLGAMRWFPVVIADAIGF